MGHHSKTPELKELKEIFSGARGTIFIASCVINVLALAFPLLMLQMYDRILPFRSVETLTLLATTVLIAITLESVVRAARAYITAWVSARFEHRALNALVNRALAEPLHQFERKGTGIFMDRFRSVTTLKYHYSGQTFQQLLDLPFTVLYVLVASLINPWIGALLVCGYAIFATIVVVRGRDFPALFKQQKEVDARRGNFLNETLKNIHTLKSMSMESLMLRRHERLQEACAQLMSRLAYSLDMSSGLGGIFSPLMTTLTVVLGAWLVINGEMTNGELAACVLLGMRALSPIQRLGGLWSRHEQDKVLREQLTEVLKAPTLSEVDHVMGQDSPDNMAADSQTRHAIDIELRNVGYKFPSATEPIFEDVSLKIKAGECVLITGEGGAGFSTLLQLMAGVLTPDQGDVLVNGAPIDLGGSQAALGQKIAYLPQMAQMFQGSLIENISLFDAARVDNAIHTAKVIGLGSFVSRLPRGWDSTVGDMVVDSLPPGYRQRLAIVRALSNNPGLILFDEATATIDLEGDRLFLEYLSSIKGQATIVIVSQRPSYQRLADRTVWLEGGRLLESNELVGAKPKLLAVGAASKPSLSEAPSPILFAQRDNPPEDDLSARHWQHTYETIVNQFKFTSDFAGCLGVLLPQLRDRHSAREVAEALPYYAESLDLAGFQNTMAQLGYKMTEARSTLGDLDARSLPCLFVPDQGMAFVVIGRVGQQVRFNNDPTAQAQSKTDLGMKGRAYFYQPTKVSSTQAHSWVGAVLSRFRPLIGQAFVAALVAGVLMIAGPLFLVVVYSTVIPSGAVDTLFYLAIGATIAILSGFFFVRHRARILAHIAGRVEYLFGSTVLQQILHMSPTYTERASVGAQTARIRSFEAIRDMFTGPLASTLLESPATLVMLIALSVINPIAFLVFLVALLLYFVLYKLFDGPTRKRVDAVAEATGQRNEFLVEMIGKMRAIRECNAQRIWLERFRALSADSTMASFKAERVSATMLNVSYFVMMLTGLAIVTISVPAVWSETIPSGALIASMILMWRVLSPVQTFFTNLTRLERVAMAAKQIDSLMKIQGERPDETTVIRSRVIEGAIEFARVSFRYSLNADPALVGVEFRVKPGELVAVSGPNGGGKSTLLRLILGMYQPQAGAILLDNIDLRQFDPLELRRLVAYAPQEVQVFRATIAQNLRLSRPDATDEEVWQALEMAGAIEQVQALPKGIEYRVGDNTNELPSSLLQKISLARAYLTKASVLLLDEPGAGLDAAGDQQLMHTLQLLKGKRTIIFITHRPSHMRLADTLLVFEKGYLRAAAPPDKLLKQVTAA